MTDKDIHPAEIQEFESIAHEQNNTPRPFLESIAKAYMSRFGKDGMPRSNEYCFVFPNKRAGTFFQKYLKDHSKDWMLSPEITTISDFVADLSGRLVNNRIDLIFLLYNCYCEILDPTIPPEQRDKLVSFDSFRKWGETVMQDFNDIDMQIADSGKKAEEIFLNVADFRKISSSFLNEEQRKVIEEYFGYHFSESYDSKFWNIIDYKQGDTPHDKSKSLLRDKFIELWKILYPLYTLYHKRMAEYNLISSGGVYRIAVEKLSSAIEAGNAEELRRLLPYKKLVVVGFNALSVNERQLFNNLKKLRPSDFGRRAPADDEYYTDFIWDSTGPVLAGDTENSAGRFVRLNRRQFPEPEWTESYLIASDTEKLPATLETIAAPSGVMQVKIATEIIKNLHDKIGDKPFDDARVALVVPDENLLLPLLYSIPKELTKVNLTMGYPLRLTAITSFLSLLRRLQLARRDAKDYSGYNFEQVKDLLSHPLAHSIFSTYAINMFIRRMELQHVSVVKVETDFSELNISHSRAIKIDGKTPLEIIFRPLDKDASSSDVIKYLDDVLALLEHVLVGSNKKDETPNSMLKGNLELQHAIEWREALRRFEDSIRKYNVKLGVAATLTEAFRLLQAEIVAFEGKPLSGLQIMGLLETRSIDFDYLIVVGLNDRTIPGRMRQRSFIPNIIRMGYGMPPNTYQEDLFGYYFYRMLSRARHATFIYDSRITGFTGGVSRYLQQLKYIYAKGNLKHIEYKFGLSPREDVVNIIQKTTPLVQQRLNQYIRGNETGHHRFLSASLLKSLTACQLKFYYKGILDIKDDPAPTPSIDRITEGNIVHDVMKHLYVPEDSPKGELSNEISRQGKWLGDPNGNPRLYPQEITPEYLDSLLSDAGREKILGMVKREIMKQFYHRHPDDKWIEESDIQAGIIRNQICDILRYDLRFAPFKIYGVEVEGIVKYPLADGREISMKYIIDRIDDIDEKDPRSDSETAKKNLRIVDYKTGGSGIDTPSVEHLFESDYTKDNLLQLLLYSLLFNLHREHDRNEPIVIRPRIYPVGRLSRRKSNFAKYTRGEKKGEYYRKKEDYDMVPKINNEFLEDISATLEDGTPVIEAFRKQLDKCLNNLFDIRQPLEGHPDISSCHGCVFFNACSSTSK
ncbi:MAG: PD-(D/E)XK nuclease family protein [Muribaculaceae bacterium]|nr:PD-(D/E)XK nuclease family protein [Muribaculaceae bacterium]